MRLGRSGPPAGALPDADFPEESFRFGPGETIVLYTDGLLEEAGGGGLGGLEDALRAAATATPDALVERLVGRLDGNGEPADDRTVLAIHRHAESTP
jgi:sigma-B regulation protein RsbU (phosphoserine phosphatase)